MIIDSFLFNDEIELLKLRLEYLYPFFDRFYIAESSLDHTGSEKKLIFKNNSHKFLKFLSKIEYCEVCKDGQYDDNERVFGIVNPVSSKIIATSRTQLGRFIQQLPGENLIHYSDVDEIPVCDGIKNLKRNNFYALEGPLYYYFYNMKCMTFPFNRLPWGLVISSNMLSQDKTLTYFRNVIFRMQAMYLGHAVGYKPLHTAFLAPGFDKKIANLEDEFSVKIVSSGCYHLSFMGGAEAVQKKIRTTSHTELSIDLMYATIDDIEKKMNAGIDLYGRDLRFKKVFSLFNLDKRLRKLISASKMQNRAR